MSPLVHRVLLALHARGFHPAVLAGLVMMPAVVAVGFWTGDTASPAALPALSDLRGSFAEPATPPGAERPRNEDGGQAFPAE